MNFQSLAGRELDQIIVGHASGCTCMVSHMCHTCHSVGVPNVSEENLDPRPLDDNFLIFLFPLWGNPGIIPFVCPEVQGIQKPWQLKKMMSNCPRFSFSKSG